MSDQPQPQFQGPPNQQPEQQQFRPPMYPPQYMPRPMMHAPPPHMLTMQKIMEEPLLAKNPTLYLQNLNEKIKIPDLKNALYQLFSNYGEVVEVHAKQNIRDRGQAFIVYKDEEAAESALKTLRGYTFFGKPLRVNYSKKQSDVITKMRGTFEEGEKGKREQRRVQELKIKSIKQKKKLIDKLLKMRQDSEDLPVFRKGMKAGEFGEQVANTKLLVEGLSKQTATSVIVDIFKNLPGFKDVNHIEQKAVAFIEFDTDDYAGLALKRIDGYQFKESNGETTTLRVTFAK